MQIQIQRLSSNIPSDIKFQNAARICNSCRTEYNNKIYTSLGYVASCIRCKKHNFYAHNYYDVFTLKGSRFTFTNPEFPTFSIQSQLYLHLDFINKTVIISSPTLKSKTIEYKDKYNENMITKEAEFIFKKIQKAAILI